MKVFQLRAYLRERGIRGYSTLKKAALEAKVQKLKKQKRAEKYEQNLRDTAICGACLIEQRVQRKIDGETFTQRLLESVVRTLVCDFCQHANFSYDGDQTVCVDCGACKIPKLSRQFGINTNFL